MPNHKRLVTVAGESLTVDQWAARTGVPATSIRSRLDKLGWPPERAVHTPPDRRYKAGGRPRADVPRPCPPLRRMADGGAGVQWRFMNKTYSRRFGAWGSPEAATHYARFAAEWAVNGPGGATPAKAGGVSVSGLLVRWLAHCEAEYVKHGKPSSEVHCCRAAARPLNALYGDTPAKEFGGPELKAVRQAMVDRGWTRNTVNGHVRRLVRCWKWAVAERLVPAECWTALTALAGLKQGRQAPDRPRRKPPAAADVDALLRHLRQDGSPRAAVLADLVAVQRLTGVRSGELCRLAANQIDRSAGVWRWAIPADKSEHLGRGEKVAYLGPKAQGVLSPLLKRFPSGPAFRWPARGPRSKPTPVTPGAYRLELAATCRAAGVPVFRPHELRHLLVTTVAGHYQSLDHAAAAIGDTPELTAAVYLHLDPDEKRKIDVARELG